MKFLHTILLAFAPLTLFAQSIDAEFEVIDMGDIAFQQPATAVFNMKNRGSEFFLQDVKPFCGCTDVSFQKKEIKKGEAFSIAVTYDAKMLGHFQKDVALISEQFDAPYYLTIKGNVVARAPQKTLAEDAIMIGKLQVERREVEFPDAHHSDVFKEHITFINTSKDPVNPQVIHVPQYMKAMITPNVVMPGAQGDITLTLYANMLPRYGLTQTTVYLTENPGENLSKEKEIFVSAVKLPSLNISESQRLKMPKINLSANEINLNPTLKGEITIENKGKTPLQISSLQSTLNGLNITLPSTTISAGSSVVMKVKGTKKQLKDAPKDPVIILITNDPSNQKVVIKLKY